MKVYVLTECHYEDYHGGGATILAVYGDWDRAFAEVKASIPDADPAQEEWEFPEEDSVITRYLAIESHDVQ